jgi:hypothetical protein
MSEFSIHRADPAIPFAWECRGLGVPMFSQLKIATKLLIGFGVILLLLAGISALAITSSQRSKDALENVTRLKGD